MKKQLTFVAAAVSATMASLALAGSAGYTGGSGPVTTALAGSTAVPTVLMLRVGTASGPDPLVLNPTLSVTTSASNWNGTAPSSTTATASVNAYAYSNSAGGATLGCSTTGLFTTTGKGIYVYDIGVATAPLAPSTTADLSHPGTDLQCTSTTTISNNAVFDAIWTYTLDPIAVVNGIPAGTYTYTVSYTLTPIP